MSACPRPRRCQRTCAKCTIIRTLRQDLPKRPVTAARPRGSPVAATADTSCDVWTCWLPAHRSTAGRRFHGWTGQWPQRGAARRLDRRSPTPLWAQLRADLRRRLAAGAFGEAFPGELALVAEYEVSRHTVRSALRELRADGIVVAERGRRPRLAGADHDHAADRGAVLAVRFGGVRGPAPDQHRPGP